MFHVLVVDDDENIAGMLRQTFEQAGYKAATAYDGQQALKELARQGFDLVVADIIMPGRDGLEIIQEMKKRFPETKIIAMTGGGVMREDVLLKMAQKFGAQKTFLKPFYPAEIVNAARELLQPPA